MEGIALTGAAAVLWPIGAAVGNALEVVESWHVLCGEHVPGTRELTLKIGAEIDQAKRNQMLAEAYKIHADDIGHIPLHQQALAWGMKKNVELVQLAEKRDRQNRWQDPCTSCFFWDDNRSNINT